jgi:hypothetical protein
MGNGESTLADVEWNELILWKHDVEWNELILWKHEGSQQTNTLPTHGKACVFYPFPPVTLCKLRLAFQ